MTKELQPLTRAASISPDTINKEARTVDVVWSTGASVRRGGIFAEPYNEVLSMEPRAVRMDRLKSGNAPVLWSHDVMQPPIGVVMNASLRDGAGTATLRFSQRPEVDSIWQDVQDGIIRNVSVGALPHKARDITKPGDIMRTVEITDWEPREISLASIGLDAGAVIRSGSETISCELEDSQEQPASRPGPAVALLRLALEIEKETTL